MDKEKNKGRDPRDREILATESFANGNKVYFFDYMLAVNGSYYIKISRGDLQPDGNYIKKEVVFFEEDFEFLLEAMSSLFRTAGYQRAAIDAGKRASAASEERTTGIKSWEPQYRPREKMIAEGPETMTDAELLALLISSGSPRETAVELAGRILSSVDFNLRRLNQMTIMQLCEFKGMGFAKSTTVMAAMELSVRIAYQKLLLGESK
jgi:DNA repair protein RadC